VLRPVASRPATYLRKPAGADARAFIRQAKASRDHLLPWVHAAEDGTAFRSWIARGQRPDVEQFLVCRRDDDAIAGFVNINNIILSTFQSASMGWAALAPHVGRGHLTDGVSMAIEVGFTQLRLHRLEANIQPGNDRSRQLATRCGFVMEGFSPRFLSIGGEWRDHERWAIVADDWRLRRR
jgi:ribosomal-protein-alanine N-acetyltransferase